jgi:hypothetical protein
MNHRKLLRIYLNDHLAALAGARELARRAKAQELAAHFGESERELERLIGHIGARRSRLKGTLAAAAEKGGRLKLNGHLVTRSPLSDLVELEGLGVLLEYEARVWRSVAEAMPDAARPDGDFAERERQALEWRDRLAEDAARTARRSLGGT